MGGLPVMALLVTLFAEWKIPEPRFWLILLGLSLPVELTLSYVYIRAFQISPQSLVGPLFSLSALFLIPLGYIFLGELPSILGAVGILSVMIGPFFLGKESKRKSVGITNIFKEKGSWYMLASAFFAASGVTITKLSFHYASPLLFTFYSVVSIFVAITVILWFQRGFSRMPFGRSFLGMVFAYVAVVATHAVGLSLLIAAYFISLKRLSIVFDVFLGRLVHKEDHFRERLAGAL